MLRRGLLMPGHKSRRNARKEIDSSSLSSKSEQGGDSDVDSFSSQNRSPLNRQYEHSVSLPVFTGCESWKIWFTHFDDIACCQGWSDEKWFVSDSWLISSDLWVIHNWFIVICNNSWWLLSAKTAMWSKPVVLTELEFDQDSQNHLWIMSWNYNIMVAMPDSCCILYKSFNLMISQICIHSHWIA